MAVEDTLGVVRCTLVPLHFHHMVHTVPVCLGRSLHPLSAAGPGFRYLVGVALEPSPHVVGNLALREPTFVAVCQDGQGDVVGGSNHEALVSIDIEDIEHGGAVGLALAAFIDGVRQGERPRTLDFLLPLAVEELPYV